MHVPDLKAIFVEALDRPPGPERAAYLDRECRGDPALRDQLEGMLRDHERLGGFLASAPGEAPAARIAAAITPGPASGVIRRLAETVGPIPGVLLRDTETGPDAGLLEAVAPREFGAVGSPGRYQIFGEIARGGMGAILRARDPDLGRELAIKVLLDGHRQDPASVRRFVEEAQVGGQLQHPGVVPVYELGLDPAGRPYFAMKLVRGRTLAALLQARPGPSHERRRFLAVFEQVCQTVAYAHSRGVIHRDLKPANVMVGAFGEVQVVDWGLAKVLARGGVADERRAAGAGVESVATVRSGSADARSEAGSILGTPSYMPPEQAGGDVEGLDERADVFALGAILCEVLTGRPPYVGTWTEVLRQAREGAVDDAFGRLDASGADAELVALARRCLDPAREARPRDAGPVAGAISAQLASADERARAAERDAAAARARAQSERRARRLAIALAAVILAGSVAGGAGLSRIERERRARIEQSLAAERAGREQDARFAEVALATEVKGNLIIERARGASVDEAPRWLGLLSAAAASAERIAAAARDDHVRRKASELLDSLRRAESLLRERVRGPTLARPGDRVASRGAGDQQGRNGPLGMRRELESSEDRIMSQAVSCHRCVLVLTLSLAGPAASAGPSPDPVEVCSGRLKAVHEALVAYERQHHQWPDHLSDLVPAFLPDASALRDPADPGAGDLGSSLANADPKLRVSYSYERCADTSSGLPCPLGPFPKPDIPGTGWGSWRLVNGHQETFFGDQVPLVRCFFHRPAPEDREPGKDLVLNLTPSGRVYRSDFDWEHHPDSAAFVLRTLDRDVGQGAGHVARRWLLFRVNEYLGGCEALDPGRLGPVMRSVADGLMAIRDRLPDGQRAACFIAAGLRKRLGDLDGSLAALRACAAYPGAPWSPITEAEAKAEIFHARKEWDREIATYEWLLEQRPDVRPYMEKLAAAYEAAGNRERAERWRLKADPGARLIGRPAPDFRVPMLSGGSVSLAEARRGKRALLLNFWFRGCEPCRLEFPHLQKAYDDLGGGLAILAVNRGDSEGAIGSFVEGKYRFPIGLGRGEGGGENPIFEAYHVSTYPTSYLIDGEGRVAWRGVGFGPELKAGLKEALAELGLE